MKGNGKSTSSNEPGVRGLKLEIDWDLMRQRIETVGQMLEQKNENAIEVLQRIWTRRAAQLAQAIVEPDQGEQIQLVLFQLGRELYGIEVEYVFDIRPVERITRVPRVPPWVAGVVNLRGQILSALDLQRFFNLPEAPAAHSTEAPAYLIVVNTPTMQVALLVDDVLAVQSLPTNQLADATGAVRGIRPEYLRGLTEYGEDQDKPVLIVLDLLALLADKQLVIHEEVT